MKFFKWFLLFLIINFSALYFGVLLMDNGPKTDWYNNLNQAPWTPQSWVFGVAWTTIMICFSGYLAFLMKEVSFKDISVLFGIQYILNVSWNYVFFSQHQTSSGLIIISLLTGVVLYFLFKYSKTLKVKSVLILPYFLWLLIATSLNYYIVVNN